ncbi:MAG: V-type ATP synthase subunit B, partial [Burkholderiaceae bacterium]
EDSVVRFYGEPLSFGVGPGILGRVFDGVGRVIDGGPSVAAHRRVAIDGLPMNPVARSMPRDFIETGISTLDLMNSLVRGQKLPLFSGGGLPHDRLAVEIASHARLRQGKAEDFAIVFAGIGVPYDSAEYFRRSLEQGGALERTALFLNLASDSSTQRLLTPRFALSAAEYLAFSLGKHVLVILTDMTNYCEALREVSSSKGEIPSRKGFPGTMYSDLATLFERAGCLRGAEPGQQGTLTQLAILTMPADDIGHPIPDLTGYITEGQIVLSRDLDRRGVYPPVNVLPSLSRLMKDGTGAKYTHADHPALASQLYAAYARATQARLLASVVGVEGLAETDRRYLRFGTEFEQTLVNQSEARTLEQSMALGWGLLAGFAKSELTRLSDAQIAAHIEAQVEAQA